MTLFSLDHASGNTSASAAPLKSSRTRRAYSAPDFLEIWRFTRVTTAAMVTFCGLHSPRVAVVRVPKSSTSARYLARGCPEMKKPSTAFSRDRRSCSVQGATSGRPELGAGRGAASPKRACCPEKRSCWRTCASLNACSSAATSWERSEEHTSELQSLAYLVCRLLLEK